jgi:hypothetical protein
MVECNDSSAGNCREGCASTSEELFVVAAVIGLYCGFVVAGGFDGISIILKIITSCSCCEQFFDALSFLLGAIYFEGWGLSQSLSGKI